MAALLVLGVIVFLVVMVGTCIVTLLWMTGHSGITQRTRRRPTGRRTPPMEVVDGEVMSETEVHLLGSGR